MVQNRVDDTTQMKRELARNDSVHTSAPAVRLSSMNDGRPESGIDVYSTIYKYRPEENNFKLWQLLNATWGVENLQNPDLHMRWPQSNTNSDFRVLCYVVVAQAKRVICITVICPR